MSSRTRWIILSAGLACLLAAGMLFRHFLFENVIMPITLVLWAVMRVFMTVDQEVYWVALVFVAFVFGLRLIPVRVAARSQPGVKESRQPAKRLEYWQDLIKKGAESRENQQILKKNLQDLMINVMAIEDQVNPNAVREAFLRKNKDVPEEILSFLSTVDSDKSRPGKNGGNWIDRLISRGKVTNKPSSGKQGGTEAVLDFLESYAEISYDDEYNKKD